MLNLITGNSTPVVSLDDIKLYLRCNIEDDDGMIAGLVMTAQEWIEHRCNLTLQTTTWKETFHGFPPCDYNQSYTRINQRITLSKRPLQAVSSVKYYDTSNTQITLDPTAYLVMAPTKLHGYVAPLTFSFPSTYDREDSLQITYTVGFTVVPELAIQTIKQLVWDEYYHEDNMEKIERYLCKMNTAAYPS